MKDTKKIFLETIEILDKGYYQNARGETILLNQDDMIQNTILYSERITITPRTYATKVEICNEDTFDCAKRMITDSGTIPCVLNMCSERHIGGTVAWSGKAQEETLVCRSTLIKSLYLYAKESQKINVRNIVYYRLNLFNPNFGAIFSPNVIVFRESDYSFCNKPFKVAVISVPALYNPKRTGEGNILEPQMLIIRNKIRTIFNVAIAHGLSTIILGAMGCGAYNNPPRIVANVFKEILNESMYKNSFKRIVFAILGDDNFKIFSEVLSS